MKRIKEACLLQTIHFQLKEDLGPDRLDGGVVLQVFLQQTQLDRSRTRYQITEEAEQPDGSILIHIKKQYNNHSCGAYMD